MNIQVFHKLTAFLGHIRIFPVNEPEEMHLFIIDGPSAIKIARLLVNCEARPALRFIASVHYLTHLDNTEASLKRQMTGWHSRILFDGLCRYLTACLKRHTILPVGEITAQSNRACIETFIRDHASQIRSLTVCNERNPFPARAVEIASQHGIRTGCIQHGAIVANYFPIHVQTYFTWSDYYSRFLRQRVPGLKTISIGRLGYRVPDAQPSPDQTPTPLIVLQPADVSICRDELLAHFKTVIDICYRLYDQISLRPHPSDNIMPEITAHIGDRKFNVDPGNLETALSQHSITLSLYSTVLYEAPLFGSLPLQYLEQSPDIELMQRCELYADSPEKLYSLLQSLQDKNHFAEYLQNAGHYARQRITSGDTAAFFNALQTA